LERSPAAYDPGVADAFFEPDGNGYRATELTRGPWDPGSQHAGPPAALIARELERLGRDGDKGEAQEASGESSPERPWRIGRMTLEILRPVPIAALTVEARVVKPGRTVELCEASLRDGDGEVIRATAWRLRPKRVELPDELRIPIDDPPPGPEDCEQGDFIPTGQDVGYHTAMEYRPALGGFLEPGPAIVWMRMRHPLVAGEEPSPLQRVMIAADSGNGVSATLDWTRFLFINVDLTVHLHRLPETEWVCLDAVTLPEPSGLGLTDTRLRDERGSIGRAAQTLLVAERGG
jgi:hypothetical protein